MATLVIVEGPAKDQIFALADHKLVMIGRDASSTIQIVDPEMSRHHMQVARDPDEDRHYLLDFNSRNGVYVNDEVVKDRRQLKDGDLIVVGQSTIVYSTDDATDADNIRAALKRFGQGHLHTQSPD